ncbi:MAG: amidase [Armatimonadetes bacterium]|nr:amidase [Armatimonadota bacterium]
MNPDVPFRSIVELPKLVETTSTGFSQSLTSIYLERLETLGVRHKAVVRVLRDQAMRDAKASDARRAAGKSRGPLEGIPFGLKDMFATKGLPTTWGSPAHQDQVFDFDATVLKRLRAAGAILIGKLAMIELAGGGNYNMAGASATGPCSSAHDTKRWAGGSSSGPGACTALGCVGFSIGSETWGSITYPSAFNGATGLRPTYGRVSRHGAMALAWSHDKIGPICRSAQDAELVYRAIAGYDPSDPASANVPVSGSSGRKRTKGRKLRIGILKEDFDGNFAPNCADAYKKALSTFMHLGYEIVSVAYPALPYGTAMEIIINAEGASAHENFLRSARIHMLPDKDQVAGFLATLEVRAADYLWALRFREEALKANEVWKKCDCIFTPTFYHAAPPIEGKFGDTWKCMGGDEGPANLLGWPAIAFPIGMDDWVVPPPKAESGVAPPPGGSAPAQSKIDPGVHGAASRALGFKPAPVGAQIIAPAFREDVCFEVAKAFQKATKFHLAKP